MRWLLACRFGVSLPNKRKPPRTSRFVVCDSMGGVCAGAEMRGQAGFFDIDERLQQLSARATAGGPGGNGRPQSGAGGASAANGKVRLAQKRPESAYVN